MFQKDADGNEIFYPWGILSKGYIIPNDATKRKIKIVNIVTIIALFLPQGILVYLHDIHYISTMQTLLYMLLLIGTVLFFYYYQLQRITNNLTATKIKPRIENFANNAQSYWLIAQPKRLKLLLFSIIILLLLALFSSLFVSTLNAIFLIIVAALFAPLVLILFFLLRYKIIQDKSAEEAYCIKEEAKFTQPVKQMPINVKNIAILLGVFGIVVAGVYGYFHYETLEHNKRMAQYRTMDVNAFAAFLAKKNSHATSYDKQLYFKGSKHHANQVVLLMRTPNVHALQKDYASHFTNKLCHSHAFYAFFKKGGEVRYEIRDSQSEPITFTITKARCDKRHNR